VEKIDDSTINKVMNVNFFGPLKLTRIFLKELLNRKEGYIVNISSMGGFFPFPGQTIYGASKAALKLLSEGLYSELLDTNVKVMVVFPGAIATDIAKNSNIKIENSDSSFKMLPAKTAAKLIIKGIEKNKFKLYVGTDSKIMNFLYTFNSKSAIKMVNKKMKNLNK
jgi:short-subunit dehydrogenase